MWGGGDNIRMELKRNRMGGFGLDSSDPGERSVKGVFEPGNVAPGSMKCKFLDPVPIGWEAAWASRVGLGYRTPAILHVARRS
jgi:hypothetical protein